MSQKKFNTPEEKKAADKIRKAEWYQKNKDRLREKSKQWAREHKDIIKEQNRKYRLKNKFVDTLKKI